MRAPLQPTTRTRPPGGPWRRPWQRNARIDADAFPHQASPGPHRHAHDGHHLSRIEWLAIDVRPTSATHGAHEQHAISASSQRGQARHVNPSRSTYSSRRTAPGSRGRRAPHHERPRPLSRAAHQAVSTIAHSTVIEPGTYLRLAAFDDGALEAGACATSAATRGWAALPTAISAPAGSG